MREIIFLLALAGVASGIALRVIEPMLPQLADNFGGSVSAASAVITAYAAAYAIAQLIYGPLGDRYGTLRVVTLALAGAAAASACCALAPDLRSLIGLRFATALFAAAPVTLGMAYIGDQVPLATRQSVIARFVTGTIVGQALGPLAGGVASDVIGWRGAFIVLALLFAAVAAVLWFRTHAQWSQATPAASRGNPFTAHLRLLGFARVRYVMACAFANAFFFFGAYAFLGAFLKLKFGLSLALIGAILTGVGIGSVLYTFSVTRLIHALGQRGLVAWGGAICCACYALAVSTPLWGVVVPCTIALGFSFYMLQNTLQVKASEMAPEARGAGISLYTSTWSLGQAAGVAAAGLAIGIVDYATTISVFGLGFFALGLWLRFNLRRLSDQ